MQLHTQAHYDVIDAFERAFKHERSFRNGRLNKEDKAMWSKGAVYQDAEVNFLFLAFRHGVAYGTAISRN